MIRFFPDSDALMHGAASMFVERARLAVQSQGRFSVALAGGSTPKAAYELLAREPYCDQVEWDRVYVFWGDERCVPPDDARSNYRMTCDALLDHVPIPVGNVHRIRGELLPADAASGYEAELIDHFGVELPRFDLVLLGLGTNGHTASLFPGTSVIHERMRRAAEVYVAESGLWRVTLTAPVLSGASAIAFLVAGAEKADVLRDVLVGDYEPDRLPAQLLRPAANVTSWLVDHAAAAKLPDSPRHA
ncbi:MAG: 6-phosphogluconolactonase [Phycisphaerales bacterium]|nr:6-phosphogluconolactonase [Phycisphaerales bacterium]MCB9863188.1 6-phosphogluconolactonase [Phycisphaerales bacterium]